MEECFFEQYKDILNIFLIDKENQIVEGKEFCEIEIVEDKCEEIRFQRCSFDILYNELLTKTLKRKESKISIREKWGMVREPITDPFLVWCELDKGFDTIHVVNQEEEYSYSITKKRL